MASICTSTLGSILTPLDSFFPLPLTSVTETIAQIKLTSGKNLIYVSEWMADLDDNNGLGGLQDANIMLQLMGQFAQAGVTEAAYWPPVFPTQPQADAVTLVSDSPTFDADADGQAMYWLSSNYLGSSLPVTIANTAVSSIASSNGSQAVVFVMGEMVANETEQVQVAGFSWSSIVSAQVMYAAGASVSAGPAIITDIPASIVSASGKTTAQFVVNPGGNARGSAWEIVKLVLR